MQETTERKVPKKARFFDGELLFGVLFALLLIFHLGVNLWWLGADNHTIRVDEEVHMENARNYYQAMYLEPHDNFFQRVIGVAQIKPTYPVHPPLLHISGAMVLSIFGYDVDHIALTNTFMFMLLLIGAYFLARQFLDQWSALFAVFVVSFTPSIYADSRYMMTDYMAAMLVVWAVYALLKSDKFRRTEWVFLFGIINGLAILTRTVAFLYYLLPSLVVVAAGAWLLLARKRDPRYPDFGWQRLLFHCLLTLVTTVGVFSPWYFHNLEHYYNYWMEQRSGVVREILPTEQKPAQQVSASAQSKIDSGEIGAKSANASPQKKKTTTTSNAALALLDRLLYPRVEWSRYLVLVINNSMFLPLFVLSVLGMFLSLFHTRFRSFASLVLLSWIFGSYFFMTQLFHFANPRYALAAVPALALLASLVALAPKTLRYRTLLMGGLAVLLLFTYGNLSIKPYKNFSKLEVPVVINKRIQEDFDDTGLVIYKAALPQSHAFSIVGPPSQLNYKDFYFLTMLEEERKHETLRGEFANYQKLNSRGMEFDEKHYWPDSPFFRKDLPQELVPQRKLRFYGGGYEPEHLLARLDSTDYIVYTVNVGHEDKELKWQKFFMDRGYKLIGRKRMERFGAMAARYHGVLAYEKVGETIQLGSPEDVETLDIFDLYMVMQSANFKELSPTLQQLVAQRFAMLANTPPFGVNFPLCEEASVMGIKAVQLEGGLYDFRIVLRVNKPFTKAYRAYIQAKPDESALATLTPEEAKLGYKEFRFDPVPATTTWREGSYVVISHQLNVPPGAYKISFGLVSEVLGFYGQPVQLEWMQLGGAQK